MTTPELCAVAAGALALDRVLGDPPWMPHPVRGIGRAALWLEPRVVAQLGRTRTAGALFAAILIGGSFGLAWLTLRIAGSLSHALEIGVALYLVYTSVAARDLDREARGILQPLRAGDLASARRALARIVGRDTDRLDEREIVRGAVESVAESTVDGCISPLLWTLVGGPAAAIAFKATNTLDSMVGHRDARYAHFGTASARADDVLGFVPARAARLLFPLAAWICGLRARACWQIAWRDGAKSPSPNAGISEAATAGALGVRLGGTNFYDGEPEVRAHLGNDDRPLEVEDIARAVRLMYATTVLALGSFVALRLGAAGALAGSTAATGSALLFFAGYLEAA